MKRLVLGLMLCLPGALTFAGGGQAPAYKVAGDFEVEVVKGIAYREGPDADPVRNQLDLYIPKGPKNYPVLLFVHGGTWKTGSKDLYGALGKLFAKNGVGTVIINYRLSPKFKHPAHIQDVARAFAWTLQNIAKHSGDPNNIFVCGHSAGGHLVSLLSTNETYLKAENLGLGNIKGTIPLSGVFVLLPNAMFRDIFTDDKDVVKSASPSEHVTGKHPPFLLIYADKDLATLEAQAELMCKKLTECKCEARTLKITDRTHLTIITSMGRESDPATQAVLEFLAKHGGLKLRAPADGQGKDGPPKNDFDKLQGTWLTVSMVSDGKTLVDEKVVPAKGPVTKLAYEGKKWQVKVEDKTVAWGMMKIDSTKKPKEIDIMDETGMVNDKTKLGIYELDGDTYKYCLAPAGKARPTEFTSKEGSGHSLGVSKREMP